MIKTGIDKLRQNLKLFLQVVVLGVFLLLPAGCAVEHNQDHEGDQGPGDAEALEVVILNGHSVTMELAHTPEQRATGLMGRKAMADGEGMLFVYPDAEGYPAEVSFWMKDCLIPIDVIFISRDGKVVSIHEMEPPDPETPDRDLQVYPSGGKVQFAIELRGGLAGELGLRVGDVIELQTEVLMVMAE